MGNEKQKLTRNFIIKKNWEQNVIISILTFILVILVNIIVRYSCKMYHFTMIVMTCCKFNLIQDINSN